MSAFIHKKLPTLKSLPEILRDERVKAGLSLENLSLKTQISLKYLTALEYGNYNLLPGEIYTVQFLKKIAGFFKLNERALLKIYHQEKEIQPALISYNPHPKKELKLKSWLEAAALRKVVITLLIIVFAGYFAWEVKNIFQSPQLIINSPASQTITAEATIEINGQTEPGITLAINQQEVALQPDGNFKQMVDLTVGLNVFKITAVKKHSRATEQTLSILRQPPTTTTINLNDSHTSRVNFGQRPTSLWLE